MFLQLLANGLVTGSVIAIAAAGVSVVYGILRLVHFAYGDVMAFDYQMRPGVVTKSNALALMRAVGIPVLRTED